MDRGGVYKPIRRSDVNQRSASEKGVFSERSIF